MALTKNQATWTKNIALIVILVDAFSGFAGKHPVVGLGTALAAAACAVCYVVLTTKPEPQPCCGCHECECDCYCHEEKSNGR